MARDWVNYNEALVKRGEILIDLDFLKNWNKELEEMNEGKRGWKYLYPWSFIRLLGFIHV